ncbi:MAG: O-methyltransferase [Sphingobacteriaceae bacterium]
MDDTSIKKPSNFDEINAASNQINFSMPSDLQTGSLLRTLISSKPNGAFLEIGTGTGLSLSWIVDGMDEHATIITIDNNEACLAVARKFFGKDDRVTILCEDAEKWLEASKSKRFDLIFADAMPGKYEYLEEALSLLNPGGLYIIDDMLPQPNWPAGHDLKAINLIESLTQRTDLRLTQLNWSTGIIILTKTS